MGTLGIFNGHGGNDSGAVGQNTTELKVVTDFRNLLVAELENNYEGVDIVTNGQANNYVSNVSVKTSKGRTLEIHCNSSANITSTGCEIIVGTDRNNFQLENELCADISNTLEIKNRGVKSRDYYTGAFHQRNEYKSLGYKEYYKVIADAKAKGEQLSIIELYFISNPNDHKKFLEQKTRLVSVMAVTIAKHLGLKKKVTTPTVPLYRGFANGKQFTDQCTIPNVLKEIAKQLDYAPYYKIEIVRCD